MKDRPGTLTINTAVSGRTPVVAVRGEVDLRTSPRLRILLLEQALRVGGTLVIDLSGVSYMDSSGVGTMVYVKREVERAGRRLVLAGLQARVRGVLEITHLDKFFTIVERVDEVVEG